MALIACEECGRPISQSASTCPHCGARTRYARQLISGLVGMLLGVVVLYVLMLTVGQFNGGDSPRPPSPPLAAALAPVRP
jgi:uncharacterized OB-fold protein